MEITENDSTPEKQTITRSEFTVRTLIATAIFVAVAVIMGLIWLGIDVILLVFAGLLIAVLLRGLSDWVRQRTGLSQNWALTFVLLAIVAVVALGVWLLIPSLEQQFKEISESLPTALEKLRTKIEQFQFGRRILEQAPQNPEQLLSSQSSNVFGRITGFFSDFLGIVANVLIVLATAIYFAVNPNLYKNGFAKLFPADKQKRVREVLDELGSTLRNLLLARIAVMAVNGALTAVCLWLLGVPLALALGVLTALLNFIPNIGPIIAAVPAVLLAFTDSPQQALRVAILYLIVQNLEGLVLTPLVQQKIVSLPPVLVLASQLLLGILFGFMGVLLAVPLVAVFFVLVKMIYVEDVLGNRVEETGDA